LVATSGGNSRQLCCSVHSEPAVAVQGSEPGRWI